MGESATFERVLSESRHTLRRLLLPCLGVAPVASRRRKSLERGNDLRLESRDRRERLVEAGIADELDRGAFVLEHLKEAG